MANKKDNTKIILDGFKATPPLDDDAILQQLFEAGNVFSDLRPIFNEIVSEKGLRLSNKERKIKTAELLKGTTEIKDADEVLKITAMLSTKLKVASTKALGSLRSWAKDNSVKMPKAARAATKRKVGFTGHYEKILNKIIEMRDAFTATDETPVFVADKKEVVAFCHKNAIPEAYSTTAMNVVHFAQKWNGEIVEEAAEEVEAETESAE